MMSELKELAILEKVVKDNTDEIEETDTYKMQIKKLNKDIKIYLNLNVNSENINN